MDFKGRIHDLPIAELEREELERQAGPLIPMSEDELIAVKTMSEADRRRWWFERATHRQKREARKRERAARKAGRR